MTFVGFSADLDQHLKDLACFTAYTELLLHEHAHASAYDFPNKNHSLQC